MIFDNVSLRILNDGKNIIEFYYNWNPRTVIVSIRKARSLVSSLFSRGTIRFDTPRRACTKRIAMRDLAG